MKKILITGLASASLAALAFSLALAATPASVPYPANYRQWTHVKSMVIEPGHPLHASFGGIHHLYANAAALKGYRDGKFPDGAVIAFDLLEAQSADHAVTEGKRKVLGVMHRDAKKFAATGGWGFEGFIGDSTTQRATGENAATACFACHQARKANDYVFSSYRP
ncbi:MAG: cytochrome P460 family protein [Peristeroidobacter soli]